MDFTKQQALDGDPNTIQQIHFTVNLDRAGNKVRTNGLANFNYFLLQRVNRFIN